MHACRQYVGRPFVPHHYPNSAQEPATRRWNRACPILSSVDGTAMYHPSCTMRIALGVEYGGREFSGWEAQVGRPTVQACLEAALSKVADHAVNTVCAGRTDAGVHASGQCVHFDTGATRPERAWILGTNSNLPEAVKVLWARTVSSDFHARFSATSRRYRYVISNRSVPPAILHGRVGWTHRSLDANLMQAGANCLLGEHDFSSFRAAACQARNPRRTIYHLNVERRGDLVVLDVVANAYLQHMVRNLVGALMAVGEGKREPSWIAELLAARDRTRGDVTMSPSGLYLVGVDYAQKWGIPRVSPPVVLW